MQSICWKDFWVFRLIKYKTVGDDLTKSMYFYFGEIVMSFLGCAMAINGEKLPEVCWTPTNPVRRGGGNTVEMQLPSLTYHLPSLTYHLLAKHWHQGMVKCTWNAKCSKYIFSPFCCHSCLTSKFVRVLTVTKYLSWVPLPSLWEVDLTTQVSWKTTRCFTNVNLLGTSLGYGLWAP